MSSQQNWIRGRNLYCSKFAAWRGDRPLNHIEADYDFLTEKRDRQGYINLRRQSWTQHQPARRLIGTYPESYEFDEAFSRYVEADAGKVNDLEAEEVNMNTQRAALGAQFTFRQILGKGGYGIVALYDMKMPDGTNKPVCVKSAPRQGKNRSSIMIEHAWMDRFRGANHLVQLVDVPPSPTEPSGQKRHHDDDTQEEAAADGRAKKRHRSLVTDGKESMILMEFLQFGTLHRWLIKASKMAVQFSNKQLWMMFECLVRGLIGMQWPPKKQNIPGFDETRPVWERPGDPRSGTDICHFDLDPANVLVGFKWGGHHSVHPIFKIGDFGLAADMKYYRSHNPGETWWWGRRKVAKHYRWTPEQFTEEWDYLTYGNPKAIPFYSKEPPAVAGNYGMHTNIYWIGLVMFNLITLHEVELPVPTWMPPDFEELTYGGALLREGFTHGEESLRMLVAQCLMKEPAQRPTLNVLIQKIDERIARGFPEEPDEATSKFALDFYGGRASSFPPGTGASAATRNASRQVAEAAAALDNPRGHVPRSEFRPRSRPDMGGLGPAFAAMYRSEKEHVKAYGRGEGVAGIKALWSPGPDGELPFFEP